MGGGGGGGGPMDASEGRRWRRTALTKVGGDSCSTETDSTFLHFRFELMFDLMLTLRIISLTAN